MSMDGYILLHSFSSTQPVLVWQIWIDMPRFGFHLSMVYFEKKTYGLQGRIKKIPQLLQL